MFAPAAISLASRVARSKWMGNNKFYSTFLDESLNLVLRNCAQRARRSTFEESIFLCVQIQAVLTPRSSFYGSVEFSNRRATEPWNPWG
eukprot:2742231-Pyramimonas_sp.AAC.1